MVIGNFGEPSYYNWSSKGERTSLWTSQGRNYSKAKGHSYYCAYDERVEKRSIIDSIKTYRQSFLKVVAP